VRHIHPGPWDCRSNVDLFGEFDDQAMWDVLSKMNMHKVIAGLDGKVQKILSVQEMLANGSLFFMRVLVSIGPRHPVRHELKLYSR
jgi:hypothetical protein